MLEFVRLSDDFHCHTLLVLDNLQISTVKGSSYGVPKPQAAVDIRADPMLFEACKDDTLKICKDVKHGGGRVQACLVSAWGAFTQGWPFQCRLCLDGW